MLTLQKIGNCYNRAILEITCLRTDKKPIEKFDGHTIANGSILQELDGERYRYDEQNKKWILAKNSSSILGREIELRKNATHIQWKYTDEDEEGWINLVPLEEISGTDGISPILSVDKKDKVTTLKVTDITGEKEVKIFDGKDAPNYDYISNIDIDAMFK